MARTAMQSARPVMFLIVCPASQVAAKNYSRDLKYVLNFCKILLQALRHVIRLFKLSVLIDE